MIGMHLGRKTRDERDERPTLDLLFGSYRQVELALQSMEARKQSLEVRLQAEARQAERALEQSGARFSSTFKYAGVGLVHADLEGQILMANHAFLDLLGYSEEELVGQRVADFTYPEDVAKGQAEMARVIASVNAPPDFMELSRHIPLLKKPFHRAELASLVGESLGQKPVPSSAT
jgi:PAS domain-containing protein